MGSVNFWFVIIFVSGLGALDYALSKAYSSYYDFITQRNIHAKRQGTFIELQKFLQTEEDKNTSYILPQKPSISKIDQSNVYLLPQQQDSENAKIQQANTNNMQEVKFTVTEVEKH